MIVTHEASEYRGLCIYVDGQLVLQARKAADLITVARDALMGQIILPVHPDPVYIHDQRQLLQIAAAAAGQAADVV